MTSKKPTWKDWAMLPLVLLIAAISLPLLWIERKIQGKNLSPTRLEINEDEMHLLEQASNQQILVFINGKENLLQPFNAEQQHIHSDCGSCPDELHLNDIKGRACLTASRELGGTAWRIAAMEPIVWGLLGYTSGDLTDLQVGNQSLGHVSDT